MTRKSKRELERGLDALTSGHDGPDLGRPLTPEERRALGDVADVWDETRKRREVIRSLWLSVSEPRR